MPNDERTAPAPASPCECSVVILDSGFAYEPEIPEGGKLEIHYCKLHAAKSEQPSVTAQRVHPGRIRAIAQFCADNHRGDFANNLWDIANWMERTR